MSFSPDGRTIIAQGGSPEWNVALWQWEKSKLATTLPARAASQPPAPVHQVLWNPQEPGTASLVGQGTFRTFKMTDSTMRPHPSALGKREPANYTAHCWLPEEPAEANKSVDKAGDAAEGAEKAEERRERCVVANDEGEILVVENNEVRSTLAGEGTSVDCVVALGTKGFICGGGKGTVTIYEKTDEKEMFKRTKKFAIKDTTARIRCMALSPSEESLICTLDDNQMYVLDMANADILKAEEMNFELLSVGFHSKDITGVDTCIKKPLVVTCSTDKSVRVWNYLDKSVELLRYFQEEAHSVAFHPSGLHVLVGFTDKLRMCNLLMDDIRPFKEFPIKQCRECVFSNGGDLFAAVNGNVIQVYNAYTCENVGNLRGHGGKVRSVSWSADDAKIVSAGTDGAVYEWKLSDFQREKENVIKGCTYNCVVAAPDDERFFAVGSDGTLREFDETSQIAREFDTGLKLTQIALPSKNPKMLFAASESGTVRAYRFPLNGEFQEFQCHSRRVTSMRLSHDDSMLFCVSDDGCMSVFDIKDKDGHALKKSSKEPTMPFAEEVLVTKADMEEKRGRMQELEMQVAELTLQSEYQLRLKDLNMNEKIKDLTEKFQAELDEDKSKFEMLLQEKNEQEMEYEEKIKQLEENHASQTSATEDRYQQKILTEVERYQQLMREKELLNERWDEQNSLLVESHERVVEELTGEFSDKLQREQMRAERIQQNLQQSTKESDETKKQMEEDADLEIEDLKEKYELRLAAERESGLRLKGENGIMKKKFTLLQKDINMQKDEIQSLFDDKKELYATIASLEKDIAGLKREIRERDDTISDKEKRIYDLKKKNQELEKFKFVLDYKIKELKKQIEPREQDIADMKETIQKMDHELERYHKNNAKLDLTIQDLRDKLVGLQKDVMKQRKAISDRDGAIQSFQSDLHETSRLIQNPKQLAVSVKNLYQKHVTTAVEDKTLDEDIQKEYNRQREFLEKSIESLKRKLHKDMEMHRSDNMRIMHENVSLIKEINELRREMKLARQRERAAGVEALSRRGTPAGAFGGSRAGSRGSARNLKPQSSDIDLSADAAREIEMQRNELAKLRLDNELKTSRIAELERSLGGGFGRPGSGRARLAPLEAAGAPPPGMNEEAAAARIQAGFRGHAARRETSKMREESRAATKIQAAHRGRAARRRVATMRGGEEEPPPPLDKEDSLGAVGATP